MSIDFDCMGSTFNRVLTMIKYIGLGNLLYVPYIGILWCYFLCTVTMLAERTTFFRQIVFYQLKGKLMRSWVDF